ncbi:hypothetical protein FQN60_002786, partial [Etheostoma spectabile]
MRYVRVVLTMRQCIVFTVICVKNFGKSSASWWLRGCCLSSESLLMCPGNGRVLASSRGNNGLPASAFSSEAIIQACPGHKSTSPIGEHCPSSAIPVTSSSSTGHTSSTATDRMSFFVASSKVSSHRGGKTAVMNVGTAHSEVNPNTRVMNSRGMWLSYILGIGLLHIILLSIPIASVPCMYLLLHTVKGTPFETPDQGKARLLTHWEQMDYGVQFTASRKFLTITPIVLYILTSFYTKYDRVHFMVNTVSLLTVLIPKLPQLHGSLLSSTLNEACWGYCHGTKLQKASCLQSRQVCVQKICA